MHLMQQKDRATTWDLFSAEFPLALRQPSWQKEYRSFDFAAIILARLTPCSAHEVPTLCKHQS